MAMTYQWKPNSRFPIGAQIAAERLREIQKAAGGITPRAVVDDARSDNSPLHKCFEWNDEKAADAHRLQQARQLIGALVVAKIEDAPMLRETRAFVNVTTDEQKYVPIEVAMTVPDLRAEVIGRAKAEIQRWRDRYASYAEFGKVTQAIDDLFAEEQSATAPGTARRRGAG